MASEVIEYDGQALHWKNGLDGKADESFKATSGLPGYQETKHTCVRDNGPVPPGRYRLRPWIDPSPAQDDGTGRCNLKPGWKIQKILRGAAAGACESYWANWGTNRIRIDPADKATRTACTPQRSGFYIHDSIKGFSHGCIETETAFFDRLYAYAKKSLSNKIIVVVDYKHATTNGGTKKP